MKKVQPSKKKSRPNKSRYLPPKITYTVITSQLTLLGICKGGFGAGPLGPGCAGNCMGGGS